jgi:farnesyl-diphosphate farnesyltransferase
MVTKPPGEQLLFPLLKSVSRSFYLTLAILPAEVRAQMTVAYLYARAADSLADMSLVPRPQRFHYLGRFREWLLDPIGHESAVREIQEALSPVGPQSGEQILLERLDYCRQVFDTFTVQDQHLIRGVMETLTSGMLHDLTVFPGEREQGLTALKSLSDLDHYVYSVAGCVGDFWTRMVCRHRPAFKDWDVEAMATMGIRFGKGLQFTNVLRDIPRDLRRGRCYIPETLLAQAGLNPNDLLDPNVLPRFKPILGELLCLAMDHLDQGWLYTMAVPRREWRVRLACVWPILFALKTLRKISLSTGLLDPGVTIKMTRGEVYRDMALSAGAVGSRLLLTSYYGLLRKSIAC